MTFYHPKYYAELRAAGKKLQAEMDKRAQPEVASNKHQAQESSSTLGHKPQAAITKRFKKIF